MQVYEFVANPENLPKWATGLGTEVHRKGEAWEVIALHGSMGLRFTPHNDFGVRDPWGHKWMFGPEVEKVSPEEKQRRYDTIFK